MGTDRHGLKCKNGRGNANPVTVNLLKIALLHEKPFNKERFFNELDEVIDLAIKALVERFEYQGKQLAASAPFLYENQILKGKKLAPDEPVREVLKHETLALGYHALSNALVALIGKHHGESEEALELGLEIVKHFYDRAAQASEQYDLNFSAYATPAESLCHTWAKAMREEFGIIEGITDKDFLNNSHHVPVYFPISTKDKIDIEAKFAPYATGGNITYVEIDGNARNNLDALEALIDYAMEQGVSYFALNHPIDSCTNCGYEGIIGNECPRCKVPDENGNICRLRRVN